ncbi:MAG: biotin--[Clostridia bacterium]|nr:biotin--[acetyl-CoA-carboxylase] ligase [Clostridia bacterium]
MADLLGLLAGGGFVSGERLSRELGVTRAAVWKQIHALQDAGWPIESGGKRGYRLGACDRLEPELWRGSLTTAALGRDTVWYREETDSTNRQLKLLAAEGAPHGSLCLCERQTAGRGRMGRVWQSPAGVGLWQSVLLRPSLPPERAALITFCAALAMADAVEESCGLPLDIKWPNDLLCRGKKVCGILLEMSAEPDRLEYVVAGVGLNVLPGSVPEELRGQAACLAEFCEPAPRREILCRYLACLEGWLERLETGGWEAVAGSYKARCVTLGRAVRVSGGQTMTGTAEDLDGQGCLLVRDERGELRRVFAGDVSVRGVMGYV